MIVKTVKIEPKVKLKIYSKHLVILEEIEETLIQNKPLFRKIKGIYMAIGFWRRYLTIFFRYNKKIKEAKILTAYPSSDWQRRMYKKWIMKK